MNQESEMVIKTEIRKIICEIKIPGQLPAGPTSGNNGQCPARVIRAAPWSLSPPLPAVHQSSRDTTVFIYPGPSHVPVKHCAKCWRRRDK